MDIMQHYTAQVAVLGSLLIEPDKLAGKIFHGARPEDFSEAPLRNIFRAAKDLFLEGKPLDAVTICNRAGNGYSKVIKDAMDATPTAANIDEYLRILQESARLKRLRDLAEKMAEALTWEDGRRLLEQAGSILTDRPGRRAATYAQMISNYLDRQGDTSPPRRLDWGIEALTKNLVPAPGWFVILGADSSVGKTALALQMALSMARGGARVGFFSYETSQAAIEDRLMANAADVNLPRSKAKALTAADYRQVSREGERSGKIAITVVETSGYTVEDLRTEIIASRFEVVFIDYVQLIPARASDRWQIVTEVSMALHTMAQQLGVIVIALSQVTPPEVNSRTGNRRPLRKQDLRESRQLINDADVILMMDLENPNDSAGQRILQIDKNKDGPLAKIYLRFDPEHMRFTNGSPPKSETYRAIDKAVAQAKREQRQAHVTFEDLPDDGPLPF